MATITTRSGKGSPLTNTEVDNNFTNLNNDKLETSGGTLTGNLTIDNSATPILTLKDGGNGIGGGATAYIRATDNSNNEIWRIGDWSSSSYNDTLQLWSVNDDIVKVIFGSDGTDLGTFDVVGQVHADTIRLSHTGDAVGQMHFNTIDNVGTNGYVRTSLINSRDQDQITWNSTNAEWTHAGGGSTDWSMILHKSTGLGIYTGEADSDGFTYTDTQMTSNHLRIFIQDGGEIEFHNNLNLKNSSGLQIGGFTTIDSNRWAYFKGATISGDSNNSLTLIDSQSSFRPTLTFKKDDGGTETTLHQIRDENGRLDFRRGNSAINQMSLESNGDMTLYSDDGSTPIVQFDSSAEQFIVRKQLASTNGVVHPLVLKAFDAGNSIDQVAGAGVGLQFMLAGNGDGDSIVGASISAQREVGTDTDSSTALVFRVTQNDSTFDEALRIDHDLKVNVPHKLEIASSQNAMHKLIATDSTANQDFSAMVIDHDASGTDATTADRSHTALFVDMDSSASGGDTNHEHRLYGVRSDVRATGDSDLIYGVHAYAEAMNGSGTVSNTVASYGLAVDDTEGTAHAVSVYGGQFMAYSYGVGTNTGKTSMFGSFNKALVTSAQQKDMTKAVGVYAEAEIDNATDPSYDVTIDYVYAVQAEIDNDAGVDTHSVGFAALYYGNYAGTIQNNSFYGVYINEDVPNYFAGLVDANSLVIDGTQVISPTRDITINKVGDATSATDPQPSAELRFIASGWDTNLGGSGGAKDVRWEVRAEQREANSYPDFDLVFYAEDAGFNHRKLALRGRGSGASYQQGNAADFYGSVYINETTDSTGGSLYVAGDLNVDSASYFEGAVQIRNSNDNDLRWQITTDQNSDYANMMMYGANGVRAGYMIGYGSAHSTNPNTIALKTDNTTDDSSAISFFPELTETVKLTLDETIINNNVSTNRFITAGRGSGGVALTVNDGYGNANVTFNHASGTPEQAGNVGRITVNTDGTTGAYMAFGVKSNDATDAIDDTVILTLSESNAVFTKQIEAPTLRLTSTTDASSSSTGHAFQIGPTTGYNIIVDVNEIMARDNGTTNDLHINPDGGNLTINNNNIGTGALKISGSTVIDSSKQGIFSGGVNTSKLFANGNTLDISVDDDGGGSNQQIRFSEGGVVRMVLEDNDLYVHDNISAGRKYEAGATNQAYDTTASHVNAYAGTVSDGSGTEYRTYIQAYNTTDPDVAVFQAHSKDVMADTGGSGHNEKSTAHLLDNGGRSWHWNSGYFGQVRVGTTATTKAYRAGDNVVYTYSGTGATHGVADYGGYTGIIGRETANGDDVFACYTDKTWDATTETYSGGQFTIEFDASGNGRFDGGADISAADYAEYFEWADGNPNNEDRRGHSVVLTDDGKIRIATADDDAADFIGIVSVEAAVVGDSAWAAWTGKWERDRFGQVVMEDYDLLCWGAYDEDSGTYKTQTTREAMIAAGREDEIPDDAVVVTKQRKKRSADYDPNREYIPRKDRPEWQAIGLMGKLPLLAGQPTAPQWRKLFDLNDEVEMWLVR